MTFNKLHREFDVNRRSDWRMVVRHLLLEGCAELAETSKQFSSALETVLKSRSPLQEEKKNDPLLPSEKLAAKSSIALTCGEMIAAST